MSGLTPPQGPGSYGDPGPSGQPPSGPPGQAPAQPAYGQPAPAPYGQPAQAPYGQPGQPVSPGEPPAGGFPPQGYPQQGYQPQGYPQQGYQPQGYPGGPTAPQGFGPGAPAGRTFNPLLVIGAIVAVFVIVGGVIMFATSRARDDSRTTGPTISQPVPDPSDPSAPVSGDAVDVAEGVTATLPDGWEKVDDVDGGIIVSNGESTLIMQIQAFSGEKVSARDLCAAIQRSTSKGLGNVKASDCEDSSGPDRVEVATGTVTGTSSTSQGSTSLGVLVLAGARDDGLVTATQVIFPTTSQPSEDELQVALAVWTSVVVSQNSA